MVGRVGAATLDDMVRHVVTLDERPMVHARSILLCLVLGACTTRRPDAPHQPQPPAVLDDELAALEPSIVAGGVIVFGELHGTTELPAFVGRVLTAVAERRPVVLGLEIPRSEQPAIEAYMAGSGGASERERLLGAPFWRQDYQDGRRSVAMLALVEHARQLRAGGSDVRVLAFDIAGASDPAGRDLAMAERLMEDRTSHPDATHVVLVGSLHAARGELAQFAGRTWMVEHLARGGVKALALRVAYEHAMPWVCFDGEADHCGPAEMKGEPAGSPGVHLSADSPNYDGVFVVPRLTTSPPVARPELGVARLADAAARREADQAYQAGDFVRCVATLAKVKAPLVFDAYNEACCRARSGDADGAFAALERARELGLAGVDLAADEDLNGLRGDPRWGAIADAIARSARSR